MKPLTTEPLLVPPQPVEKEYRIVCPDDQYEYLRNKDPFYYEGIPFETREEAIDCILEDLGLKIVYLVKPINKRGPHFE